MNRPTRVLVLDEEPILRYGVAALLDREPDMLLVGEGRPDEEGLTLVRAQTPDVVITELPVEEGGDGLGFLARLRETLAGRPVVVLTGHRGTGLVQRTLAAGVAAFLPKQGPLAVIIPALRDARAGRVTVPEEVAAQLAMSVGRGPFVLTARERDVLARLAQGESNRQIAAALAISEATVKTHLLGLYEKLGVSGRLAALTEAIDRGLVHAPGGAVGARRRRR